MMSDLKIATFNCQGFKSSEEYVAELFNEMDFLALQEHWLNPAEFSLFSSVSKYLVYLAKSPMAEDEIVRGRPFGGVSLFWHRRHQHAVFHIDTVSDRMVAIKVSTSVGVVLMIALYMPVDYGDCNARDEYITELGFLEGLLDMEVYDHVVLLGDFNADLHRNESRFSARMSSFLSEYDLMVIRMEDAGTENRSTWHSYDMCRESWIDYICVSTVLRGLVDNFSVRDDGCVLSDHWAIVLSIQLVIDTNEMSEDEKSSSKRLRWKEAREADIVKFQKILEMELDVIDIPVEAAVCNEPISCKHQHMMQSFYDS